MRRLLKSEGRYHTNFTLPERNLLSDGTRNFAYDDENELVSVWQTNVWREDYAYDGLLRKRVERQYSWNGSSWLQTNEIRYEVIGAVVCLI